jgi:hypothetical protein
LSGYAGPRGVHRHAGARCGHSAFAHAEAGLFTREAWSIFLDRLDPRGILTVSRWFAANNPMESGRLVSLAVASLRDRGATDPAAHIAIVSAQPHSPNASVLTLLLSRDPFSEADRAAIRRLREGSGLSAETGYRPDPVCLLSSTVTMHAV